MKPTISIIVPVYNVEPYLGKCLESIMEQTFKDFEVILINDGSTDKSGVICNEFALRDKRFKVLNKENGGLSSARNAGLKIAQGEYISFVDGDDWIEKNMHLEMYTHCIATGSDISICKFGREINNKINFDVEKKYIKEMNNKEGISELFKGKLYRFSACNKLFKRGLFDGVEFPEGRIHEDLSTTYKLFAKANKVVFLNYVGYIYVMRENSILTSKYNVKRLDAFIGWDEILSFMKVAYPNLSNDFISCFVYGCVDHIYYILNQVINKKDQEKYLMTIQQYVRKNFSEIIKNPTITLKYKYLLSLLNYNVKFLMLSDSFLKKLNRQKNAS
jgi:glycosyltransferase involved in cell wall biosynthesis